MATVQKQKHVAIFEPTHSIAKAYAATKRIHIAVAFDRLVRAGAKAEQESEKGKKK
jgi:hypothetical protein